MATAPKTIKEFYLELADGTINYEYNDDTGRKFNLDNLILTDENERQVLQKEHEDQVVLLE